jgi:hypothetical protein
MNLGCTKLSIIMCTHEAHLTRKRGEMLLSTTQHPVVAALFAVHNWGELRMREKSESVTAMGQRAGGRKTWYRQTG